MKKYLILVLVLVLSLSGTASAYMWWDNDSADQLWATAANWNEGEDGGYGDDTLPDGGAKVAIIGGLGILADDVHVYINTGTDAICKKLFINRNAVHGTIFGGTAENGYEAVATAPVVVTVDGGSLTTTANEIRLGSRPGDYGLLELIAGAISIEDGSEELQIGEFGTGVFNMLGGTLKAKDIQISYENADSGIGYGYMNISGGVATLTDDLEIAKKASDEGRAVGALTMSGGSISVNDNFDVGTKGIGSVLMSGGTIEVGDDFELAKDGGTASVVMSGGTITVGDDLKMGQNGGQASIVMSGGTIYVGDQLRTTHEGQPGTSATVSLGDGDAAFGDVVLEAIINTKKVNMQYADDVDITVSYDFLPGGLLLIRDGDKTGDVQDYIDAGYFLTTYVGDYFGVGTEPLIRIGYDFGLTVTDVTAVYLIPEPATIALLGFGGLALIRRKRS